MRWTYKSLPRLIIKAIYLLVIINGLISFWRISDGNALRSLSNWSSVAMWLLFAALVTVVEKPTGVLTEFVIICDMLIIAGLILYLWNESSFALVFLIVLPIMALLIVLSRPKTAHYMMDKYHESVRQAEKESSV